MLDPDVTVLKQTEDARFEDGVSIPFIRISFKVGKHGPFSEKIDKSTFSQATRDQVLNTFAQQVRTP